MKFAHVLSVGISLLTAAPTLAAEPTWIVEKPLSLTIHMHFRDRFVWNEDWPVAREIARLTNIKLVNTANKAAINSNEQFNLLMASGDLPDIVGGDNRKDDFIRYGMEGAFIPLNDLIEKHAPNLKAFFKGHPDIERAVRAPDGNIYYIPYVPDGEVARGWMIRADWLAKLGLKVPTAVDELHDVLKAFKERDPNGNGQADEIPFFHRDQFDAFRLLNLFGSRYTGSEISFDFYAENGEVKHAFGEPALRGAMRSIAQWYKEGLIDPEIFTRRARAREELFGSNRGGMTHDWFASTYSFNETIPKTVPGFRIEAMLPVTDSDGKRWHESSRLRVRPDGWAITAANKKPIETIKLFDFYFSPKGRTLSNFGVEGQQYEMRDGKPVYKDEVLKGSRAVNSQMYDIGAQIPLGYWQDYTYEEQWTSNDANKAIDMYKNSGLIIPQFTGVNLNQAEREVYDKYWPDIKAYIIEMGQNWFVGAKDVDKTWDDYIKRLKALGYDKVLAVMRTAYDRQYKN